MFGDLRNAFQGVGGGMGPFVCMIAGVFISSYIVVISLLEPIQYKVTLFFFFFFALNLRS